LEILWEVMWVLEKEQSWDCRMVVQLKKQWGRTKDREKANWKEREWEPS